MHKNASLPYKMLMLGRATILINIKKISSRIKQIDIEVHDSWREYIEA